MLFDDDPSYSAKEVPTRDCHSALARCPLRVRFWRLWPSRAFTASAPSHE